MSKWTKIQELISEINNTDSEQDKIELLTSLEGELPSGKNLIDDFNLNDPQEAMDRCSNCMFAILSEVNLHKFDVQLRQKLISKMIHLRNIYNRSLERFDRQVQAQLNNISSPIKRRQQLNTLKRRATEGQVLNAGYDFVSKHDGNKMTLDGSESKLDRTANKLLNFIKRHVPATNIDRIGQLQFAAAALEAINNEKFDVSNMAKAELFLQQLEDDYEVADQLSTATAQQVRQAEQLTNPAAQESAIQEIEVRTQQAMEQILPQIGESDEQHIKRQAKVLQELDFNIKPRKAALKHKYAKATVQPVFNSEKHQVTFKRHNVAPAEVDYNAATIASPEEVEYHKPMMPTPPVLTQSMQNLNKIESIDHNPNYENTIENSLGHNTSTLSHIDMENNESPAKLEDSFSQISSISISATHTHNNSMATLESPIKPKLAFQATPATQTINSMADLNEISTIENSIVHENTMEHPASHAIAEGQQNKHTVTNETPVNLEHSTSAKNEEATAKVQSAPALVKNYSVQEEVIEANANNKSEYPVSEIVEELATETNPTPALANHIDSEEITEANLQNESVYPVSEITEETIAEDEVAPKSEITTEITEKSSIEREIEAVSNNKSDSSISEITEEAITEVESTPKPEATITEVIEKNGTETEIDPEIQEQINLLRTLRHDSNKMLTEDPSGLEDGTALTKLKKMLNRELHSNDDYDILNDNAYNYKDLVFDSKEEREIRSEVCEFSFENMLKLHNLLENDNTTDPKLKTNKINATTSILSNIKKILVCYQTNCDFAQTANRDKAGINKLDPKTRIDADQAYVEYEALGILASSLAAQSVNIKNNQENTEQYARVSTIRNQMRQAIQDNYPANTPQKQFALKFLSSSLQDFENSITDRNLLENEQSAQHLKDIETTFKLWKTHYTLYTNLAKLADPKELSKNLDISFCKPASNHSQMHWLTDGSTFIDDSLSSEGVQTIHHAAYLLTRELDISTKPETEQLMKQFKEALVAETKDIEEVSSTINEAKTTQRIKEETAKTAKIEKVKEETEIGYLEEFDMKKKPHQSMVQANQKGKRQNFLQHDMIRTI